MAPRPPYATDEPESFYETPNHPQRRLRQPAPVDPNKRTSAYNVYDNYLTDSAANRQSGLGALGSGFMNGAMDDDEDEDDIHKNPIASPSPKEVEASKHAMLAAATGARRNTPTPPPQYIASPRPGYAAPIQALNIARPEPAAVPAVRQGPGLQIDVLSNPFETAMEAQQQRHMFGSGNSPSPIAVPNAPHPLQPPMTPITPVFARPRQDVKFDEKPIMRSNTEETLLPSRGQRGDDFWRRFSMVVKEESSKPKAMKESSWLRKTQDGTNRMSRWVFIIGLILALAAAGGIGLGWYIGHTSTSQTQPTAIGGSAEQAASSLSSVGSASPGAPSVQSSLHVSPTNTVARREPEPSPLYLQDRSQLHRRQHLNRSSL